MDHINIQRMTSRAIYHGILKRQPCEVCGISGKIGANGREIVEAHHDDYNRPMEVRWLCFKHHREWHRHNKAIIATALL